MPFFVKAPGQTEGRVDESLVRNIDVVADHRRPARDGRLLARRTGTRCSRGHARSASEFSLPHARLRQVVAHRPRGARAPPRRTGGRWAGLFGTGTAEPRPYGDPWAEAYRIGPHHELLDRRVSSLPVAARATGSGGGCQRGADASRSRRATHVPHARDRPAARVPSGEHRDLAVAVNGGIRAVGPQLPPLAGGPRVLLDGGAGERRCAPGANRLELFEVRPAGALRAVSARLWTGVRVRRSGPRSRVRGLAARVHERAEVALAVVARRCRCGSSPRRAGWCWRVSRLRSQLRPAAG